MNLIDDFCQANGLGPSFYDTADDYYLPLLDYLVQKKTPNTLILGINGTQGAGKSTLAEFLASAAATLHGWRVTCLSLDDIYLSKSARESLSREVHPLLRTRGVPGTHDLDLGVETLSRLCELQDGETLQVPRFDKAADDQLPKSEWYLAEGKQDLVIFEGWCVGCRAQPVEELDEPVNELESKEDPDKLWRRHVNKCHFEYEERLWSKIEILAMLKVSSFEDVYHMRSEQERRLVESLGRQTELSDPVKLRRFISHYQRITNYMLADLPARADILMKLNRDRRVFSMRPDLTANTANQIN